MSNHEKNANPDSGGPGGGRTDLVPAPAVRRLSLYLRELEQFLKQEKHTISSRQLGEALGYTDAQVRKDLAYFGQFGHPGVGYRVDELMVRIRKILGTDRDWRALVVGAGNLGQALVTYRGFLKKGIEIVAVLDNDPGKIGRNIGDDSEMVIQPFDQVAEIIEKAGVEMAIMTIPAESAQPVADALVAAGIKGILNFAPASVTVPENIPISSVDLSVHLEQLAFRICTFQVAGRNSDAG